VTSSSPFTPADNAFMTQALDLAEEGRGAVEPNPLVGAVVVKDGQVVGQGWHAKFGGPHAEVAALESAGAKARGATLYVTLEPCAHQGKTPPCSQAVIAAGISRVVAAMEDPFPQVAGQGFNQLREAGIEVASGLLSKRAAELNAPYLKLLSRGRPWMMAKWAMTLDGRIATSVGDSQWISSDASRAVAHQLRGRVDGIMVGSGTARADNPQLTARPAGPRTAVRIIVDGNATLPLGSKLVQTARECPVLVAVGRDAPIEHCRRLESAGCEVLVCEGPNRVGRLESLLDALGKRRMTNILIEGGGRLLGNLFDIHEIDEVHAFIGPKLIGGAASAGPIGGNGVERLRDAMQLSSIVSRQLGDDVYLRGRIARAG